MTNRAIVIYPNFENIHRINEIRQEHDPLHHYIDPHLTLVFPFASDHTKDEIIEHMESQLKDIKPFELMLRGISGASDGYVFLDVKKGNDVIIEIHDNLYNGLLKPHHYRFIPYTPHITIAKISDDAVHKNLVEALKDFDTEYSAVIDKITLVNLDNKEESTIEHEHKLI